MRGCTWGNAGDLPAQIHQSRTTLGTRRQRQDRTSLGTLNRSSLHKFTRAEFRSEPTGRGGQQHHVSEQRSSKGGSALAKLNGLDRLSSERKFRARLTRSVHGHRNQGVPSQENKIFYLSRTSLPLQKETSLGSRARPLESTPLPTRLRTLNHSKLYNFTRVDCFDPPPPAGAVTG